eukprot:gene17029-13_t
MRRPRATSAGLKWGGCSAAAACSGNPRLRTVPERGPRSARGSDLDPAQGAPP